MSKNLVSDFQHRAPNNDSINKYPNMTGKLNSAYSIDFFNDLEDPKGLSSLEKISREKYCSENIHFIKAYQELKVIVLSYVVEYRKSIINSSNPTDCGSNSLPTHTQLSTRQSLESLDLADLNWDDFNPESFSNSIIFELKNKETSSEPEDFDIYTNYDKNETQVKSRFDSDVDSPPELEDFQPSSLGNHRSNRFAFSSKSETTRNHRFSFIKGSKKSGLESNSLAETPLRGAKPSNSPQNLNSSINDQGMVQVSNNKVTSKKNGPFSNHSGHSNSNSHQSSFPPKDRSLWRDLVRADVFVQIHTLPLPSTISQAVLSSIPQKSNKINNFANKNSKFEPSPQDILDLDIVAKTRVPRPLRPYFQDMYSKFFFNTSDQYLNIPGNLSQSMVEMYNSKNMTYGMFDSALEVVLEMTYLNLYSPANKI
ncbi:hypothetical protein AYI68_g4376 [Smittium mucronatum]|uniref:RGS domain-containing protein n=1 Tax=Smittium mucronatum TaxID=133383 RepID=A0A1R0GXD9_9FUNG|nr:hypothetical protein AYI68_g4376 [Smittium mucronatum]